MHASEVTPEAIERANELYWHSSRSVNKIADELDLSKGALYGIIVPLSTGLGCPLCGDEVVFPNRTAKDRELLDCPTCDWDGSPDETVEYEPPTPDVSEALARSRTREEETAPSPVPEPWIPTLATTPPATGRSAGGPPAPEMDDLATHEVDAPVTDLPSAASASRTRTVVAGALLGAAAGLALVLWARRR